MFVVFELCVMMMFTCYRDQFVNVVYNIICGNCLVCAVEEPSYYLYRNHFLADRDEWHRECFLLGAGCARRTPQKGAKLARSSYTHLNPNYI